jgi:hypothetical protein
MKRRKPWIVSGIAVIALAAIGVGIAVGNGASGTGRSIAVAPSKARIHKRNLQLEALVLLLRKAKPGGSEAESTAPARQSNPPKDPTASTSTVSEEPAEPSGETESSCDPNYEGACLDPSASDYDCEGGSGNGPDYTGEVTVVGEDHFGLDSNGNGIGCES